MYPCCVCGKEQVRTKTMVCAKCEHDWAEAQREKYEEYRESSEARSNGFDY